MPDGPAELTLVIAAIIGVSAVLQTSTGFGFAILSAPLLTALLGGPTAVTTITITGAIVDALILGEDVLSRVPIGASSSCWRCGPRPA